MSLFGCYGQKNGSTGGPLFPASCKPSTTQAPPSPAFGCITPPSPVFGCTTSEEVSCTPREASTSNATTTTNTTITTTTMQEAPAVSMDGACEKFCLDMSATQFGMCKCGFDRHAHEKKKETIKGASLEPKVPAVTAVPPPATTKKSPAFPMVNGKGKGKGKTAIGNTAFGETEAHKNPEPAACQKSFDAIARLQAVIQGAGFSPLPSDVGTEAAKHVGELPDVVLNALLSIMDAISEKTDRGKRVSIASVNSTHSIEDPISRMDSKASQSSLFKAAVTEVAAKPDARSIEAPRSSLFKSTPPALCQVPTPVQNETKCSSTSHIPAAPQIAAECNTEAAACNNFQVDLTSSQFGMCRCGFARAAHSSLGKVNQTMMPRGRDTTTREVPSAATRYSSAPPPPTSEDTPAESDVTPCSNFVLDTAAAQFGMCRCGFGRSSHTSQCSTAKLGGHQSPKGATGPDYRAKATREVGSMAKVRSASARFGRASGTEVSTSISNQSGPCGAFQLDMSSAQFGMCQCGFDRNAHKHERHIGETNPDIANTSSRTYTLDQLRNCKNSGKLDGLDASRLEDFLEEREFLKAFGMFIADFYKLPVWKQKQAKQKAGIY